MPCASGRQNRRRAPFLACDQLQEAESAEAHHTSDLAGSRPGGPRPHGTAKATPINTALKVPLATKPAPAETGPKRSASTNGNAAAIANDSTRRALEASESEEPMPSEITGPSARAGPVFTSAPWCAPQLARSRLRRSQGGG